MYAILALLLLPVLMIIRGLYVHDLWLWFITPIGFPPISVPNAIGLSLAIFALTRRWRRPVTPPEGESEALRHLGPLAAMFISLTIAWVIGFIVHHFFM